MERDMDREREIDGDGNVYREIVREISIDRCIEREIELDI